jgi:predicted ATPase/DNA-binding CsgD family transcriptional regulator
VDGTLTAELSAFVGREAELGQLARIQAGTRLLTLVGPGGVGKTRLARRLASDLRAVYPDGIWFVELASVADPAGLAQAVASAIGVREHAGQSSQQALIHKLRGGRPLLILDNCEHLVEACSELATLLLRNCPNLRLLATSREPFEAEGDTIWRVPPLSLPPLGASTLAEIKSSEAVQLFVTRGRARRPELTLGADNCRELAAICRQLDGLPLAIELVAAHAERAADGDLGARLGQSWALPSNGQHSTLRRQHTLRATLDWSHERLNESERILFRRLAVFAGGCSLDAAEAVCADDGARSTSVLDALERLVARALVVLDHQHGQVRYHLLETVRVYALERLRAADEEELVHYRHAAFMVSLAERAAPEALNVHQALVLGRERENLTAALAWTLASGANEIGLRLATAAFPLWYLRAHYAEGRNWLVRLLEQSTDDTSAVRARAEAWLGQLLQIQGEYAQAEAWLLRAYDHHQMLRDARGSAIALAMLGQLVLMRGQLPRARALCTAAAAQLRELASPAELASRLQVATIAIETGDLEEAQRVLAACESPAAAPPASMPAWLVFHKGRIAEASGDTALAARLLSEALDLFRSVADQQAICVASIELAHVLFDRHLSGRAAAAFAEALDLAHTSGERILLARALEGKARSLAGVRAATAVRLAGAADSLRSSIGASAWPSDRRRLAWLADARRHLRANVFRAAWDAGRQATAHQAVALVSNVQRAPKNVIQARPDPLTRREREVVALLARALSNDQIAAELTISPATARTHVDHVLAKLGLHSRAQVAVWATQRALGQARIHAAASADGRRARG